MKALIYHGPGTIAWEEVPKPAILDDTDAIVRVDATTICGTDLHIWKGDVPEVTDGRILGHEAVGTIEAVGSGVKRFAPVTGSSSPVSPPAEPVASVARVAMANASVVAVGSSVITSTEPKPNMFAYRSPTPQPTRFPQV